MAQTIPFLLCGKIPTLQQACREAVKPEFKVAQVATTVAQAKAILAEASSSSSSEKVHFVVMGGGFSNEDMEQLRRESPEAKGMLFFRPFQTAPDYAGPVMTQPPAAESVAARLKTALSEKSEELKQLDGRGGDVWYF